MRTDQKRNHKEDRKFSVRSGSRFEYGSWPPAQRYGEAVHEVLEDFRLDDDETEFLRELQSQLGLTEAKANRIFADGSMEARSRPMSQAGSRDRQFTEQHVGAGEFTGRADGALESAIEDALAKATLAIPKLHWFEVMEIAGYVTDGKTESWHVTVRAGIRKDEA